MQNDTYNSINLPLQKPRQRMGSTVAGIQTHMGSINNSMFSNQFTQHAVRRGSTGVQKNPIPKHNKERRNELIGGLNTSISG
jgi:hypothetical protein